MVSSREVDAQLQKIVCNDRNRACMERTCNACANKSAVDVDRIVADAVCYSQWSKVTSEAGGFQSTKCIEV
jgi:hypothetical protein